VQTSDHVRRVLNTCLVLVASLAVSVVGAVSAQAGPSRSPAHNGQISFGKEDLSTGFSLWVADANGRHERRLIPDPTNASDWAPDGRWIAFDAIDGDDVHLAVIRPDGTGRRTLTSAPGVQEGPSWSPDGRQIAFDHRATTSDPQRVRR
jgi:TolB protein